MLSLLHLCLAVAGCFGFGIAEHIDLGIKYDPSSGIYGLDFYVVLKRKGARIGYRKYCPGRMAPSHRITREDAMNW